MNHELRSTFDKWKEELPNRYLPPHVVNEIINKNSYSHEIIGTSFENRPIYKLNMGSGPVKLLFWSQMHGNESTATRAMFDLWKIMHTDRFKFEKILNSVEIHFIPQLNPDGAHYYKRRNAANIDINRDFNASQTPEMIALKKLVHLENYEFLFNMHDQRTIFHPEGSEKPASLSFLAPVVDNLGTNPINRQKSIELISCMLEDLQPYLPNQLSRFSDEFYPNATGDNFQRLGFSTILIECGHFPGDYKRNETRKYTCLAILKALESITSKQISQHNSTIYSETPINDQKSFDIIYYGVEISNAHKVVVVDLGIQFEEILEQDENEISFVAKIMEIGDLTNYFGHDIYHAENRVFENGTIFHPIIGQRANFKLGEWNIENGKPTNRAL